MTRSEASELVQTDSPKPLVSVVIVNYNAWTDVEGLTNQLRSAPEFVSGLCEVVVVDNASEGPIPDQFRQGISGLTLIARTDNGGFSVGVNSGWRGSRGEWILLLNPDLVASESLLANVVERARGFEADRPFAPGVVGFALRNQDGTRQHSVGAFPTLVRAIWEQFLPRSRRKYQPGWKTKPGPVDWVTGACMLVDRRMLEALGGLDEEFFLYYEEVALCREASKRGWRVEYDPGIEVVHLHPLQTRPVSAPLRVITRHSKLLYFRKFRPKLEFLALCGIVAAESQIKAFWARMAGDQVGRKTWETVSAIERDLRNEAKLGGQAVLKLAESVVTRSVASGEQAVGSLRPENPGS